MVRPVVIVGGGIAGLSAARVLHEAGRNILVIESGDQIGGKVRSDTVDGFTLDRGYQVHFSSYPNLTLVAPPEQLEIGAYHPGALMRDTKGTHVLEAPKSLRALVRMAFEPSVPFGDKLRVGMWTARTLAWDETTIRTLPDYSTERQLREVGFSGGFLNGFLRPFLGGIFLDRSLSFSRRQFAFVWRCLASGAIGLPRGGMGAIPALIASTLPPSAIRLNTRVASLVPSSSGGQVEVRLVSHEVIEASAVILAADARESGRILGQNFPGEYNGMVQVWLECAERPLPEPMLLLNGTGKGIVNSISPSSMAQPAYAPPGRGLLGATVVGNRDEADEDLIAQVITEVEALAPEAGVKRVLACQRIPESHLKDPPGFSRDRPGVETSFPGVFLAGEITTNTSLDGAAASGMRAARKVLDGLPS